MASLTSPNRSRLRAPERLKRRSEFLRAARQGKKGVTAGLIVQARTRNSGENLADSNEDAVRVGFTVTKKVGNAVIRNRVRRRLKAAAAEVLPNHALNGQDMVIIGRMATIKRPFAALKKDLEKAIRKLNADRNKDGGKTVS